MEKNQIPQTPKIRHLSAFKSRQRLKLKSNKKEDNNITNKDNKSENNEIKVNNNIIEDSDKKEIKEELYQKDNINNNIIFDNEINNDDNLENKKVNMKKINKRNQK